MSETELRVRILSKVKFDDLLDRSQDCRQFVFHGFDLRMIGLMETTQILALETIESRLAKYL